MTHPPHLALTCDRSGRITELHSTPAEVGALTLGVNLGALVTAQSRTKLGQFLAAIARDGHAIGWELTLDEHPHAGPFYFAGAAVADDRLLILAAPFNHDLLDLLDQLRDVHNEQANKLRLALKELSHHAPQAALYTEMSQLNSEMTNLQRELARRNARLEHLLRQRNQLLGMAAHDLRNPLAASLALTEHLLADAGSHRETLDHLRATNHHMLAIVENLLDLSTFESGTLSLHLEATDLPALIDRAIRLGRELAHPKQITIDLVASDDPMSELRATALDPHKITQALTNLLSNAIKFSHPRSAIEVRLASAAGIASIAVIDHGIGIADELLPDLFEPFRGGRVGTHGERPTGLGLAIVRRIVRGHGGEVTVSSVQHRGTTFTITLPLRPAPEATEVATPADAAPPRRSGDPGRPSVLIADDEPIQLLVLRKLLEEEGLDVRDTNDTASALAAFAAADNAFDLVLVDLEMPDGGGLRIAQELASNPAHRRPQLVALTGHRIDSDRVRAVAGAFDEVVRKPLDRATLRRLLGREGG